MDIIIGAGATGLAYASFTTNPYIILEADNEIGGYCKTIKQDGFVWDYSGHFFHFRHPEMEEYICKYILPDSILKCHKHTQIRYKDIYVDFPFQKNIHQLDKQELIECLYDLFNNKYTSSVNFLEMLYCKFGKSISEKFLRPYNEKLYACDLNHLDKDAMGRFFPYADKEDIIRNFKSDNNTSYNDFFTYPRGGAIDYINSIAERVDNSALRLGEKVMRIDTQLKMVYTNKSEYHYDNLISTIPFPKLLELCGKTVGKSVYSWNKVLVFNLGFDSKGTDQINNWVYFPDKSLAFYRVGYYDNIFNDQRMSLYVELGFSADTNVDVEYWKQRVLDDLKRVGVISGNQQLVSIHSVIMDPAYVHITSESIEDVKIKKKEFAEDNIYSIGRYGSWTYCSIEDGLLEAQGLAKELHR